MERRVSVRGIVMHKGKLLCTKLRPYNDLVQPDADWWCLPGGTVEVGELIEEALVREFQEETGVAPLIKKLMYVHQFKSKNTEHLEFFFAIKNDEDFLNIDLSATSHGSEEIEAIEFVDIHATSILPSFLRDSDLERKHNDDSSVQFVFSGN